MDPTRPEGPNVGSTAVETTPGQVERIYGRTRHALSIVRNRLARPLTFVEKVLYGHLDDPGAQELVRGESLLALRVDRVAMQDATAQMALLQFGQARLPRVAVPATVHCDHLIRAHAGAQADTQTALTENREVYDFLASASQKYGIGFFKPGSGIIHQVVYENFAFPGGLMIGTDSHTPNAGGLGMIAVGVGGADAVDALAGMPWEVLCPRLVGIRLTGSLSGWAAPKDVILWVAGRLTVQGGTNKILEYFGPGTRSLSGTGKGTITNMGAEVGATTSIFPYDERMGTYLRATGRQALADIAERNLDLLGADPEVERDPERFFDEILELDLSKLEPHIVGPHSPDRARPISALAEEVRREGFPDTLAAALIGSCTNSSYEDLGRVRDVAQQAARMGLRAAVPLLITPGSDRIYATVRRNGHVAALEAVGATVLANACGPCIGQWRRDDAPKGTKNSILTSFNRNFPGRNDGNPETMAFIASPEIVMAVALAGRLSFNPLVDALPRPRGEPLRLAAPAPAPEVPPDGFEAPAEGFVPPAKDGETVQVAVSPTSQRLQLLDPFPPWDGEDFLDCPVLIKVKGKCTTDHISPAGPWLRFRGHLDRISDNLFTGAENAFGGPRGTALDVFREERRPVPEVARAYRQRGLRWVAVGDANYGEGSSREHAAMSPRYLGACAILARSFARIHETNLKKQGLLPLTFEDPAAYERVREGDRVSLLGLGELAPGRPLRAILAHRDGTREELALRHSMTAAQIEWFRAGSALNRMRG